MSETLSRIQARLRPRLDEILPRLTGTHLSSAELALQFSREIREGSRKDAHGSRFAPDQYTLTLSPKDITAAEKTVSAVQEELSQTLGEAVRESGFAMQRTPHITVATDPTLRRGQARLIAWHSRDPLQMAETVASPDGSATGIPGGAFLIVEGRRHFPLTTEIVKIGRSTDNDLLLGDPHVSRKHAELRAQGGRYVVHDLDSTAGIRVNGELVRTKTLEPGDVITLAEVEMVYGEDPQGPPGGTAAYRPPSRPRSDAMTITPLDLRIPTDLVLRTAQLKKDSAKRKKP
jgi:hypothetical protein